MIDVLRASTTITTALQAGASSLIPVSTVDEAREFRAAHPGTLAGGERGGQCIDGFDLGNSPLEYTAERVAGRCIAFTTTNGTRAIAACQSAGALVIGSFVNARSIVDLLRHGGRDVALACAGTDGAPTLDDVLLAGWICESLTDGPQSGQWRLGVAARAAREIWRTAGRQLQRGNTLYDLLCQTRGGQNLLQIDRHADIRFAAEIDRFHAIPRFDSSRNRIIQGRPVHNGAAGDKLP